MARKKNRRINKTKELLIHAGLSIFIYKSDLLEPQLNELTVSYISFNKSNSTDTIKMKNIQKNKKCREIKISGKKGTRYEVILYPSSNLINYSDIIYSINDKKNTLDKIESREDKGKIIYTNTVNKEKIKLCMWISDKSKENTSNIDFDVIIK